MVSSDLSLSHLVVTLDGGVLGMDVCYHLTILRWGQYLTSGGN